MHYRITLLKLMLRKVPDKGKGLWEERREGRKRRKTSLVATDGRKRKKNWRPLSSS